MTNLEQVKALVALGEKATKGEWFIFDGGRSECKQFIAFKDPRRPTFGIPLTLGAVWSGGAEEVHPDAAFIAASKNTLPALQSLVEEVEKLRVVEKAADAFLREEALSGMAKSQQGYNTQDVRQCRADLRVALAQGGK